MKSAARNREHPGGNPFVGYEGGHAVPAEEATFIYAGDDHGGETGEAKHLDIAEEKPAEQKELSDFDYRLLAKYLLVWIHEDGKAAPRSVMTRSYCAAQFVVPEIYGHASNTALAQQAGLSRQSFNKVVSEFRDHFRMVLTNMKSEDARKVYANKPLSTKIKHAQTRAFNKLYKCGLVLQGGAGI